MNGFFKSKTKPGTLILLFLVVSVCFVSAGAKVCARFCFVSKAKPAPVFLVRFRFVSLVKPKGPVSGAVLRNGFAKPSLFAASSMCYFHHSFFAT